MRVQPLQSCIDHVTTPPPIVPPSRTIRAEDVAKSTEFRHLDTLPRVRRDLKYATADNFAKRNLYGDWDGAWLHRDAAAALSQCAARLERVDASLHLLVLDALRPHRVQKAMWAVLKDTPLKSYIASPARGSIHAFGMAVDLTLARADGTWLDMGSGFDELNERSHPEHEARFLAAGTLTREQVANRQLLRNTMAAGGFHGIRSEWWHFDCGDRQRVRETYARVE